MKRYKLLKDLFDHNAGEIITENDPVYSRIISEDIEQNFPLNPVEFDLYTRLGVIEEIDENVRWKPEKFGEWFWVSADGEIVTDTWNSYLGHIRLYEFGNCFRTKQEAEAWRDKIKSLQKEV